VERLEELDAELADELAQVPEAHRILVTPHDAYSYFADHYGFEVATVVGVSTEEEPSASQVQHLVDVVRETGVPTVFVESTVNPAVIERIAADAGVEVGAPLYGDSVGEPGSGADDYVGMMRANVAALVDGLAP
jgi:manganese/iron transport system substrate-binding protein